MPVGDPIPMVYYNERPDTERSCGDKDNGFVSIWNWGLLNDGSYTAIASDDDGEFDRSTFSVTTFGTAYLEGASGECRVPDFPMPGESTTFEWNESTQHLEAVSLDAACMEELTLESGEICSSSIPLTTPLGEISFSFDFFVDTDGQGCISGGTPIDGCYPDTDSLPAELDEVGISIMKNTDGSWTIDTFPSIELELPTGDLGECRVGLTVGPGAMCNSSINLAGQEIGFIFTVEADGQGCVEPEIDIEIPCFNTAEEFENTLSVFGVSGASVTKNDDGSWTINSFPTEL